MRICFFCGVALHTKYMYESELWNLHYFLRLKREWVSGKSLTPQESVYLTAKLRARAAKELAQQWGSVDDTLICFLDIAALAEIEAKATLYYGDEE